MICPSCKKECPEGSRFCPHCGVSIEPVKCSNCGIELTQGFKFCPHCGSAVQKSVLPTIASMQDDRDHRRVFLSGVFSFRRVGAILTLILSLLTILLMILTTGLETSFLSWVLVGIRLYCAITGFNSKTKTPALILIADILVHLFLTIVAFKDAQFYNQYYNTMTGRNLNYNSVGSLDGILLIFLIFLLPALMMLITPSKYKNQTEDNEREDLNSDEPENEDSTDNEVFRHRPGEDEWECPNCGTINKNFVIACRKCMYDKPKE